jgi:ASPIC and UnbV
MPRRRRFEFKNASTNKLLLCLRFQLSINDRRFSVGLGNDSAIRQIRTEWSGGAVQEIACLKVDQILQVEEEAGAR